MTSQNQKHHDASEPHDAKAETARGRKAFVEPEISQPVDVLEATTFFQVLDSGGTGDKGVNPIVRKGGRGGD